MDSLAIYLAAPTWYKRVAFKIGFFTSRPYTASLFLMIPLLIHGYGLYITSEYLNLLSYWIAISPFIVTLLSCFIGYIAAVYVFQLEPIIPLIWFGFGDTLKKPTIPMIQTAGIALSMAAELGYYWCYHHGLENWGIGILCVADPLIAAAQYWFTMSSASEVIANFGEENLIVHTPFKKKLTVPKAFILYIVLITIDNLWLFLWLAPVDFSHTWAVLAGPLTNLIVVIGCATYVYSKYYKGDTVDVPETPVKM
jgi:hypothetical protein